MGIENPNIEVVIFNKRRILRDFTKISKILYLEFFAISAYYLYEVTKEFGDPWKSGDWLINYESGMIRRGLFGSFLLFVSDFGLNPLVILVFLQITIYFLVFRNVIQIFTFFQRDLFAWILLLSPAFILFPFYYLGGGFRKEIILFLCLSLLCKEFQKKKITLKVVTKVLILYTICVFSHEGMLLYGPFLILVIFQAYEKKETERRVLLFAMTSIITIGLIAAVISAKFPGDNNSSKEICDSLTARGLSNTICDGAIAALGSTSASAFQSVNVSQYLATYSILFALSLFPLFFLRNTTRGDLRKIVGCSVFTLPLYLVGIDWGRWIHITVFCLFLIVLKDDLGLVLPFKPWRGLVALVYLTTWSVPTCCTTTVGPSFFQRIFEYLGEFVRLLTG